MEKYVYLIHANDGKYKIGSAKVPENRIKQLQTGNTEKLTIVGKYLTKNYSQVEKAMHRSYNHALLQGEWFNLSIEDEVEFTNKCKKIDENINYLKNNNNEFI